MLKFLKVATLLLGFPILLAEAVSLGACNFAGRLCQYAVIGPDERGIIRQNVEALQRQPDQNYRIRVDERRFLFANRIDVYADQQERSDLVGSFTTSAVQQYEVGRDGQWAIFFTISARQQSKSERTIPLDLHLFDAADGFKKRINYFECMSFDRTPAFRALNIVFARATKELEFDADGSCQYIKTSGDRLVTFEDDYTRSGRIILQFDDDLILKNALAKPKRERRTFAPLIDDETAKKNGTALEEASKRVDACRTEIRTKNSGKQQSEFQFCAEVADLERTSDYYQFSAIGVHAGKEEQLHQGCSKSEVAEIRESTYAQLVCVSRSYTDPLLTQISITGAILGGVRYDLYLTCDCTGFKVD